MENKIINYINQTPENTNPSVLATLLGELKVPKPLTYDYMPEGYPKKTMETVTLMEEQELAFVLENAAQYMAYLNGGVEIVEGQTYTVNWDGAEYECVCVTYFSFLAIGNPSIASSSAYDTGEPFIYMYDSTHARGAFSTLDTSASHTISVKQIEEIVTPMAEEFLPENLATKSDVAVVRNTANAARNTANAAGNTANAAQTTAENAKAIAENAQTIAENAQTTAESALERVVEPYTRNAQMAPLYKNGGFSAWRDVVQSISYDKTEGYFFVNAFDTTAIKEEDIPRGVFCVKVYVGSQPATAFLSHFVTANNLWSVNGFAVITYNDSRAGELLYVSANTISKNEAKGLFLTFRAPNSMLLKSSTANSDKQFRITVDDSGTISATEVTS